MAWAARLASTWLLEKVKERRFVKGQTHEETCKTSGKWNVKDLGESEASVRTCLAKKARSTDWWYCTVLIGSRVIRVERRSNFGLLPVFHETPAARRGGQACGAL